jgi:hypothetical protein
MVAVNDWLTQWQTTMEDIDTGIDQATLDTNYQKQGNAKQATENRSASDEAMAARGIFQSSLRDAATYDIEASRALADTFLDSKLNAAVTAGATRKQTLATSKINFEAGMKAKYGENAKAINDDLAAGYANALANYKPPKATKPTTAPAGGSQAGDTPTVTRPATGGGTASPTPGKPNQNQGSGSVKRTSTFKPSKPPKPKPFRMALR